MYIAVLVMCECSNMYVRFESADVVRTKLMRLRGGGAVGGRFHGFEFEKIFIRRAGRPRPLACLVMYLFYIVLGGYFFTRWITM